MQFLKQLDDAAVAAVANKLLDTNGQTTTLEVKEALRQDGYLANQADVSAAMDGLQYSEGWYHIFTGTYRTYYRNGSGPRTAAPAAAPDDEDDDQTAQGPAAPPITLQNAQLPPAAPGSTLGALGLLMGAGATGQAD
jgi:hypothetical protein